MSTVAGGIGQPSESSITTSHTEIDQLLNQFGHFGVQLGLERIQTLLSNLGHPHRQVPVIHVAGSNGKGSVCAYLSAVLTYAGYRVGRYTSPHLVDWCERISLNEQPIASDVFLQVLQQVQAAIRPDIESPTQFEIITAAAWLYFAQQQVDVAVIEVGLGGRLDATNVCDRPLVSVITSISREHWQRLGPTLGDIAREKAGILKPSCPAVIGSLPPEAQIVVEQRLTELDCPAIWPPAAHEIAPGWVELQHTHSSIRNPKSSSAATPHLIQTPKSIQYPLPLQGSVQLINSALAVTALQLLQQQGWQLSEDAIAQGMAKTRWPGRLQWVSWQGHRLLVDGAHNEAGAKALRQFVDRNYSDHSITWLMGMISTKDHEDIFQALLRPNDQLHLVPVPDHTSANVENLAALAQQVCPNLADCLVHPDLETGLKAVVEPEGSPDNSENLIVFCGSLYLLGHFFKLFNPTFESAPSL